MGVIDIFSADSSWFYILTMVGSGLIIALWLRLTLKGIEQTRIRRLDRQARFEAAVETETPVANPVEKARAIGKRNIRQKYAQLRKTLITVFIVVWGLAALIPLLEAVPAVYVSFLIGSVTVLIGVAAKPFVENVISGLVISFGQPIRIGDTIELDDVYGTVEEVALTYSVIKIWDWRRYVIPNMELLQKEFINYSLKDNYVWRKVQFFVAPDADLKKVEKIAIKAFEQSEYLLKTEAPSFWVMNMFKDSIECWAAGWAEGPADAWSLAHEVRVNLTQGLRENGILTHKHYYSKCQALFGETAPHQST